MGDFISRKAVLVEAEKVPLRERNYRTFGNVVRSIPAADVVEVRHGKWEIGGMFGDIGRCSNCHYMFPIDTAMNEFRYCPNCGAKMDGGQDDV